jgi:hypothetical protein
MEERDVLRVSGEGEVRWVVGPAQAHSRSVCRTVSGSWYRAAGV